MTGAQVFERAMQLAGIDGTQQNGLAAAAKRRAHAAVCDIYAELFAIEHPSESFEPPADMQTPLRLSARSLHYVMPYGILMLLCLADDAVGDGARYTELYNRRRSGVRAPRGVRADVLPRGML
jgi:hypothetical protein